MATLATLPELVLPQHQIQFLFTPEDDDGNFIKLWCTSAPQKSKLRAALDGSQSERVLVLPETDITRRPSYTFDVGGIYVLELEEFKKGAEAYGGRYRGDPDGYRTEERKLLTTVTISVATFMESEIGISPDTATLQLYVRDDSIVSTTEAVHGVTTPRITKTSNDKAKTASDSPPVVTSVAALNNVSALTAVGVLSTQVTDWIDTYNRHIALTPVHVTPDSVNSVDDSFRDPTTLKALTRSLAECLRKFIQHITDVNPNATDPSPGSAVHHQQGGFLRSDWTDYPIASGGSTIGACQILVADLWRTLDAHQQWLGGHQEVDSASLTPLAGEIPQLHRAFLSELALLAPTVPNNEHSGKVALVSGAGFKEA